MSSAATLQLSRGAERPRDEHDHRGRLLQRVSGRLRIVVDSQLLDVSEFAEVSVERAEGQVTGFSRNLQDQAI